MRLMYYKEIIDRENVMSRVKVSPKYQIVIPQKVRDALHLKPGQRIQVILYGNRIELIPERKISEMRGFLKGIDKRINRSEDRL
jgi:AbrB family looped-hinge helix DNA binding protein